MGNRDYLSLYASARQAIPSRRTSTADVRYPSNPTADLPRVAHSERVLAAQYRQGEATAPFISAEPARWGVSVGHGQSRSLCDATTSIKSFIGESDSAMGWEVSRRKCHRRQQPGPNILLARASRIVVIDRQATEVGECEPSTGPGAPGSRRPRAVRAGAAMHAASGGGAGCPMRGEGDTSTVAGCGAA
jgi:hypothetical protein